MATKKNGNANGVQQTPKYGIGIANAVVYHYPVGDKLIEVKRYLKPIKDLKFDPENHRLESKLMRANLKPNQANLEDLLLAEAEELIPGLRVSGGISEPALVLPNGTVKEGNRRLAAFRRLFKGDQAHPGDSRFEYMPVEELSQDIDKADLQMLLSIRHVRGVKPWESRERARAVIALQKTKLLTDEQVCQLLGWDGHKLTQQIQTAALYDEYDAFIAKHARQEYGKEPNPDKLWTYFFKVANKPEFHELLSTVDGQKSKFFGFIHNGQFHDCLNIDQISTVWNKPSALKIMEDGGSFKEATANLALEYRRGREDSLFPNVKAVTSGIKRLTKKFIRTLTNAENADKLTALKQLKHQLDGVFLELDKTPVPMPKKQAAEEEAA